MKIEPKLSPEAQQRIADLRSSRPYDGRRVTLREKRGGWRYQGITGICAHLAEDRHLMVLVVEHDPDNYWPAGMEILAELDHESVPDFHPAGMKTDVWSEANLRSVLDGITFAPSCLDMGWAWHIEALPNKGWLINTTFRRPDTRTGEIGTGTGRQEFVPIGATESAVVKTAWLLAELIVRHELMEAFLYKGVRIFDPHRTVEDLSLPERAKRRPVLDFDTVCTLSEVRRYSSTRTGVVGDAIVEALHVLDAGPTGHRLLDDHHRRVLEEWVSTVSESGVGERWRQWRDAVAALLAAVAATKKDKP